MTRPVIGNTNGPGRGLWSWLESILPDGMRFAGPATSPRNRSELLATANCFNSGAGVSCYGFKNLEEYLAAARVSEDLGIPIQKLREKMQNGRTLSQAVQDLRPGAEGQIESMKAEQQARSLLKDFSS